METPNPESEQQDTAKKQQNIDKKIFLLFTKQQQILSLMIEMNQIMMEILLYGDKE